MSPDTPDSADDSLEPQAAAARTEGELPKASDDPDSAGSRRLRLVAAAAAVVFFCLWTLGALGVIGIDWFGQDETSETDDGVLSYTHSGLWEQTEYRYQLWPQAQDWIGQTIEGTFVTDEFGHGTVYWEATEAYEFRYGNDSDGWSPWTLVSSLSDTGSSVVSAVGTTLEVNVEMRPVSHETAVASEYLRFELESEDEAFVYLLWPQWTFRLWGPNDDDWREDRSVKPGTLAYDFDDLNLLCVNLHGCDLAGVAAGQEPLLERTSVGRSCVLRS